jgi:hypothetical protein
MPHPVVLPDLLEVARKALGLLPPWICSSFDAGIRSFGRAGRARNG